MRNGESSLGGEVDMSCFALKVACYNNLCDALLVIICLDG